ncbi:MAG TPA: acetyltransferase [Capillimicrobium sp.]|nr:acetyltransferase [Capillimicrobium sp.]
MSRLVVAAAGGFGREVLAYARDAGFDVKGILHDVHEYPGSLDGYDLDHLLLGTIDGYEIAEEDVFAVGLGDPAPRTEVTERLVARGARLATIVHPTAWVAPTATLGAGVVVAPFACVAPDAVVGDWSLLNTYASVGHDARLGRGCILSPYATVNGWVELEAQVFLGTHATVGPRRRVGERSSVSAGSVVLRDVPARSLAAGNPARSRELYPSA